MMSFSIYTDKRGDQIGGIFADWVIVYLGSFVKITQTDKIFWLLFPLLKLYTNFNKTKWLGYILGDFSKNSSGHLADKRYFPPDPSALFFPR
jgi:hypothetical protein